MGWRDLMGAPAEAEPPYTQNPHNPQNPRPPLNFGDIGDFGYMPPAPESEPVPAAAVDNRPTVDNFGAVDNSEPAGHCPACGSPSWWRAPGAGWRCSWCEPRPVPLPEGFEALTLASGQWAPGCAPPAAIPTTVADLLELHGPTVAGCRTADILAEADDDDLPELRDRDALDGFARALAADRRVRPLPPAGLPLLHRLALEIGDDVGELREYLDRSTVGRALRVRLEREHGAVDRCLLALRADPDGPLLLLLARTLDGASHTPSSTRGADR